MEASIARIDDKRDLIHEIATEVYRKAGGNVDSAVELFHQKLNRNPKLFRAVVDPLIDWAIRDSIERINRQTRVSAWRKYETEPDPQTLRGIMQRADDLMNYRLPGGKRLGDATKGELLKLESFMVAHGKTTMMRGHWYGMIGRRMKKDNEIVKEALTEEDLKKLQEQAERGAA